MKQPLFRLNQVGLLVLLGFVLGACLPDLHRESTPRQPATEDSNPQPNAKESAAQIILRNRCSACHGSQGSGQGKLHSIPNIDQMIADKILVPGNAAASRIYIRTSSGSMPPTGALSQSEVKMIKDWIESLPKQNAQTNPPSPQTRSNSTKSESAPSILSRQCASCHGKGGLGRGDFDFVEDIQKMINARLIVPDRADLSPLYERIRLNEMPPKEPLPQGEALEIERWINQDLKNFSRPPPLPPLKPTYSSIYEHILKPRCLSCHGKQNPRGLVDLSQYEGVFRQVDAGSPETSDLFLEVANGRMPKKGELLKTEQINAIANWIAQGALNN